MVLTNHFGYDIMPDGFLYIGGESLKLFCTREGLSESVTLTWSNQLGSVNLLSSTSKDFRLEVHTIADALSPFVDSRPASASSSTSTTARSRSSRPSSSP